MSRNISSNFGLVTTTFSGLQTTLSGGQSASPVDFYVGPSGSDTNIGTFPAAAFLTLTHATTVLGSTAGKIQLLSGINNLPVGGLAIGHDQSWSGAGMATHINGSGSDIAQNTVVTLKGGRSELRDCWVVCAADNTIAVKVTN